MIHVICFAGGTCGDLITALIDPTGIEVKGSRIWLSEDRCRLKKPHLFPDRESKNLYLEQMTLIYKSLPSHDFDYHKGQKFIGITVEDFGTAHQAATRFKNLHRPHVWQEMQNLCGAKTVEDYAQILIDFSRLIKSHAHLVIGLEDIVSGRAIEVLSNLGIVTDNRAKSLYQHWLSAQTEG